MANKTNIPLPTGFMLTSIIGLMISILFVWKISETWGFAFTLLFIILFISSVVNMSRIDANDKYGLQELAIHEKPYTKKKNIIKKSKKSNKK